MKTSLGKWTLGAAIAAFVLAPAIAQGPGRPGRGPGGGPDRIEWLTDALGLSEEQQHRIQEIMTKHRTEAASGRGEAAWKARQALDAAIHDAAATDAQVQEAAAALAAQEAIEAVERHRMFVEIGSVLTEEQRAKAAELRQRRPGRPDGPPPGDRPHEF